MANRLAYWKNRPEQLIKRLEKAEKKLLAGIKDASGTLARRMNREVSRRVIVAKRVSRQDSPDGKIFYPPKIAPFRVSYSGANNRARIQIDVRGHWVGARTAAVQGVFRYLGQPSALYRRGLWLDPKKKPGTRARDSAGPFRFYPFSTNPRLSDWALEEDKGFQFARHVVELPAAALRAMILDPTLRKSAKKITATWRKLVKEWSQKT